MTQLSEKYFLSNICCQIFFQTHVDNINPGKTHLNLGFVVEVVVGHLEEIVECLLDVVRSGEISVQTLHDLCF